MRNTCGAGAGRNGGSYGGRHSTLGQSAGREIVVGLFLGIALGLLTQGVFASAVRAEPETETPAPPAPPARLLEVMTGATANRDSLMTEIREYSEMIRGLRDSLSLDQGGLELSPAQREKLEGSIAEISDVIERISSEMSRMEFEIKDNRISLVNEAGEGIVIMNAACVRLVNALLKPPAASSSS